MRAHPLGCLRDRDEVLRIAAIQSRVTHGHPRRRSCGASSAVLVFDGIAGVPPSAEIPAGIYEATFATAWRDADRHSTTTGDLPAHLRDVDMSGWATVAAAHAISLHYNDNPEVAIGAAAASGCDTDTIASIVPDGGIPGADFDRVCVKEGQRIRSLLRNGGRILIHCRAGLGRTGLLAAVILVDFGESRKQQSRLYGRRGTIRSKHLLKNRT
jgi:ADP-ribosylglycohydrolase